MALFYVLFLLLATFSLPQNLIGDGQWKEINTLTLPSSIIDTKKIGISPTGILLGILYENRKLLIFNLKKEPIKIADFIYENVDDFAFSSQKDDIIYLKMRAKTDFKDFALSNNAKRKECENILKEKDTDLSSSTNSQNSLDASIEVLSPSEEKSQCNNTKTFPECNNTYKEGLFAVINNSGLIKIFNLNSNNLKSKTSDFREEQQLINVLTTKSGVESFRFLLNKKFFMILQKNGTLKILETDTWKTILEQRDVSFYYFSDKKRLLGILKKDSSYVKIFRHIYQLGLIKQA